MAVLRYKDATGWHPISLIGAIMAIIFPTSRSSMPAGGFKDKAEYDLGVISSDIAFLLADGINGVRYFWTFETGATVPNISWPAGIVWADGITPTLQANKHYEVLFRKGYGYLQTFAIRTA